MLIVCTQDPACLAWASHPNSGALSWGLTQILNAGLSQALATQALENALSNIGAAEDLCLYAHGNNHEIGDPTYFNPSWMWTFQDMAALLAAYLPQGYTGKILIQACATQVSNFSAYTAYSLSEAQTRRGLWLYGYKDAILVKQTFPPPELLDKNVSVHGTEVGWLG